MFEKGDRVTVIIANVEHEMTVVSQVGEDMVLLSDLYGNRLTLPASSVKPAGEKDERYI